MPHPRIHDPVFAALVRFGREHVPTLAASVWDAWLLQSAVHWQRPAPPQPTGIYCPAWGVVAITHS